MHIVDIWSLQDTFAKPAHIVCMWHMTVNASWPQVDAKRCEIRTACAILCCHLCLSLSSPICLNLSPFMSATCAGVMIMMMMRLTNIPRVWYVNVRACVNMYTVQEWHQRRSWPKENASAMRNAWVNALPSSRPLLSCFWFSYVNRHFRFKCLIGSKLTT